MVGTVKREPEAAASEGSCDGTKVSKLSGAESAPNPASAAASWVLVPFVTVSAEPEGAVAFCFDLEVVAGGTLYQLLETRDEHTR